MILIFLLLVNFELTGGVSKDCFYFAKRKLCESFRLGGVRSCMQDVNMAPIYYPKDDCMAFVSDHPETSKSN